MSQVYIIKGVHAGRLRIADHPFQRLDELLPWNWKNSKASDALAA